MAKSTIAIYKTVQAYICKECKNILKMNKEVGMLLQKRANTRLSGVYRDK